MLRTFNAGLPPCTSVPTLPLHLLGKWTFGFANVESKALLNTYKQYAPTLSSYCTETRRLKPLTTMSEEHHVEPPDLSTWSADQLIARVTFLEQQLKEQTVKCLCPSALLQTVLIR